MTLRTSDIAKELGVHVNTVRLYEMWGYLPAIPRSPSGYRQFSALHLEQARLVHLTLCWPYLGEKKILIELVKQGAQGNLTTAMELANKYLAHMQAERAATEAVISFLEQWGAASVTESLQRKMSSKEVALYLNVTVDTLRNWERSGLLDIPRDPVSGYRLYGTIECGRIRVIRTLVQAGYSLMAILHMLHYFDAGHTNNLGAALELPPSEESNVNVIADRWYSSLQELEQRAHLIIRQIRYLMQITHFQTKDEPISLSHAQIS